MVRALLALLGGVLVRVSAPPSDPPKLAQFSGDVRAAALRGDELSGVRPYTVQLAGGGTEYVYVLTFYCGWEAPDTPYLRWRRYPRGPIFNCLAVCPCLCGLLAARTFALYFVYVT